MHVNGTFFTRTTTAKLLSEQYFGMKNRNSMHGKISLMATVENFSTFDMFRRELKTFLLARLNNG